MLRGERLGEGTFGIVYSGSSPSQGREYAVKRNITEKDISFVGVPREMDLLNRFRYHPHIISLEIVIFKDPFLNNVMSPLRGKDRRGQRDDTLHFAFNRAREDLTTYLRRKGAPNFFVLKKYMVEILLGVEHVHRSGVIHRDIKPCNILLFGDEKEKSAPDPVSLSDPVVPPSEEKSSGTVLGAPGAKDSNVYSLPKKKKVVKSTNDPECSSWSAKICDFGLAKPYTYQGIQTEGTVTSWYRAPEIILAYPNYDYKVDVWSLGCTFFEMVSGQFFVSCSSDGDEDLLRAIIAAMPTQLDRNMRNLINTFKKSSLLVGNRRRVSPTSLQSQLNLNAVNAKKFVQEAGSLQLLDDLLTKMLTFNWKERISVSEALDHPFFADFVEKVATCRQTLPNLPQEEPMAPLSCIERTWMADLAQSIFETNLRSCREWYRHRCLFQAISIFDRYLLCCQNSRNLTIVESKSIGQIHSKRETELRFFVCLYLAIKYFSSIHSPVSFEVVAGRKYSRPDDLIVAENFEIALLRDHFNCDIYRPTLYEAADSCGDYLQTDEIRELLFLYLRNVDFAELLPREVYSRYRESLRGKGNEALKSPFSKDK